jgi:EpsI family protein
MTRDTLGTTGLCVALAIVGGLAWVLRTQPQLEVDTGRLDTLPVRIGDWDGINIPVEATVEAVLQADHHVQRAYRHPSGEIIWSYIGYYGTRRGGRLEHVPRGCYTGAGWGIGDSRTVEVDPVGGLRVNEYHMRRDGEDRLVHYWYRSHRGTGFPGGIDFNLDRMLGRLLSGRADGAPMRVSTRFETDDITGARGRLMAFASAFDQLVDSRWSVERES